MHYLFKKIKSIFEKNCNVFNITEKQDIKYMQHDISNIYTNLCTEEWNKMTKNNYLRSRISDFNLFEF